MIRRHQDRLSIRKHPHHNTYRPLLPPTAVEEEYLGAHRVDQLPVLLLGRGAGKGNEAVRAILCVCRRKFASVWDRTM